MSAQLPPVVIACRVLQGLLEELLPPGFSGEVQYLDYGFHRVPQEMVRRLQSELDGLSVPSLVGLGYGLCGNGLHGLEAGRHRLLIPRVDDCISILLGSREEYLRQFQSEPGTYWLSKGWLEAGSDPLREYERYTAEYGKEDADWMMDAQYRHYRRLALVAQDRRDLEHYGPQARKVADFCGRWGMRYEEVLGSDRLARRLINVLLGNEPPDGEFLVIEPGGRVEQGQFLGAV